jgi:UDP-N-acetylglucosamine 3-dehydrogenase
MSVRCALVGVGVMGAEHAQILATSPLAELVACVDVSPDAAERVPAGVPFLTSLADALATPDLEALFIATPQAFHEEAIRAGLERGLHVFCEKPIAESLAAADRIVALESANSGRLVIGHMYRFDPRFRAVADAVAEGRVGRVVHLAMRCFTPDYEGRALAGRVSLAHENAVHLLDAARWIAGDVSRVYGEAARTGVTGSGTTDALAIAVRFVSGAVGTISLDWAFPTATGPGFGFDAAVVGSSGAAWIDARDEGVTILGSDAAPEFPRQMWHRDLLGAPAGLYRTEDEWFLAGVRDRRPWPVSAADAREALRLAIAVDRSVETGAPVDVTEVH